MNTLRITQREGTHVWYVIEDEKGVEVGKGDGDFPEVVEEARARKKALAVVLAEKLADVRVPEASDPVVIPAPTKEVFKPVSEDHTHAEFYLDVPEHRHDLEPHAHTLQDHEHPVGVHTHPFEEHDHPLAKHDHPHEHDLEEHGHKRIDTLLDGLERRVGDQERHKHPFPEHEHEDILTALNDLLRRVKALEGRDYAPLVHEHDLPSHHHKIGPHDHPELVAKQRAEGEQSVHEHDFSTWKADGRHHCSVCDLPDPEELPATGVSERG